MQIRVAVPDDAEQLVPLSILCRRAEYMGYFSDEYLDAQEVTPERLQKLRQRIQSENIMYFVAVEGDQLV